MRWYWRADLPTVTIDSLLEGSLVGVVYLGLAPFTHTTRPLPLVAFWLAAAAGLAVARLSGRRVRLDASMPVLVVLGGVFGYLVDGGVGWLLGAALLRGALHVDPAHESDVCVDAVTFSLPAIGFAMLLEFGSGASFTGQVLATSLICLVVGMVAIGRGRQREFELGGPVAHGRSSWPVLGVGLAAWSVLAVPAAYVAGKATVPLGEGPARSFAAWAQPAMERGLEACFWFMWQVSQLMPMLPLPAEPLPSPTPGASQGGASPVTPAPGDQGLMLLLTTLLVVALTIVLLGVIVVLCLMVVRDFFGWRRAGAPADLPEPPPSSRGRSPSALVRARRLLSRPPPPRRSKVIPDPTTAEEAYLALLEELADVDELARSPNETPLDHAHRVGGRLEPVSLSLLAADYQLATYGRVAISEPETARAVARWRRLRAILEELVRTG